MSTTETQSIPVPEPGLTQDEIVQRARDMIPVLRERQEECERIGRLPDETSRDFVEAGFYRILQPRRFGGYEFDLPTFTRVAIALARGCPASGWTYTLTAGHAHMLAALWSEEGQIDIYGADGEVRMPGRFRPGTATAAPARAATASRARGTTSRAATRRPTWPSASCSATTRRPARWPPTSSASSTTPTARSSTTGTCSDCAARAPSASSSRTSSSPSAARSTRSSGSTRRPRRGARCTRPRSTARAASAGSIFSETASVAIGTAWGVLDLYEESLRKRKTTVLPLIPMTEHAQYPRFFGEAFQSIDVAESALLQSDYDYMDWSRRAAAGEIEYSRDLDWRLQLRKQYCAKLAYDAVNLMMRTNGSAGMRGGAMWQRLQRDLTVLMTHNTVQPELAADSFGRLHFGLLPHGVEEGAGPVPPTVR